MLLQNASYPTDGRVLREATALTEAGYEVTVICPRAPGQPWRERMSGVRLVRFPTVASRGGMGGFVMEYVIAAAALAALSMEAFVRRGFDVVHCHNPPDFLTAIAALYKPLGARLVFDQHDLAPELFSARFGSRAGPVLRRALERLEISSWRLADLVIASNESQRQVGLARSGTAPGRTEVVRNGPDWRITERGPVDGRARRPDARVVIGYGGVIGPQDGVDYLVRAVSHLVAELGVTDVKCVVVGDGDALHDVRAQAEAAGVANRMSFVGWVPYEELVEWLAACDVCVAPEPSNPYNDSCTSLKVMEYMALGRPIVAFDLPEHRHSAGDAAVYVAPGDERALARMIVELMDDDARRDRMGEAGRRRVRETLAWTHEAPRLVTAYARMLAS
jgi:glycosyltransferase involved in cell wall biosynthesis